MNCKWCGRVIVPCELSPTVFCKGYIHKEDGMHYCGGITDQPNAKAKPEGEGSK